MRIPPLADRQVVLDAPGSKSDEYYGFQRLSSIARSAEIVSSLSRNTTENPMSMGDAVFECVLKAVSVYWNHRKILGGRYDVVYQPPVCTLRRALIAPQEIPAHSGRTGGLESRGEID